MESVTLHHRKTAEAAIDLISHDPGGVCVSMWWEGNIR